VMTRMRLATGQSAHTDPSLLVGRRSARRGDDVPCGSGPMGRPYRGNDPATTRPGPPPKAGEGERREGKGNHGRVCRKRLSLFSRNVCRNDLKTIVCYTEGAIGTYGRR
jgi:hypothetical protein